MSNWPIICAAVAAFFSAVAAISAYRLQKRVAFQSFTPFISLSGWQVNITEIVGSIEVKKIKNYGNGPALRIHAFEKSKRAPLYYPGTERNITQAVLPKEERNIAWHFFLENASSKPLRPGEAAKIEHMNFQIVLSYSDINNRRYYTILDLLYVKEGCMSTYEKLTPELILQRQKTIVRYDWFIRLMGNLNLIIKKVESKTSSSLASFAAMLKTKKAG
jgi:hypothetical protein